jgi:hypothetical protein
MLQSIYANSTARFDGTARALTDDELFKLAPSVFAVEKHDSRSDRFQPIPTIEIIRAMAREGFAAVGAKQSGSRDAARRDFTKHLIRFRKLDDNSALSVGDTTFEIMLRNANDGTSAYDLMSGLFRVVCKNSLVSAIETVESVKIRHTGTAEAIQGKVIDGTYSVLKTAETVLAAPQDWSAMKLQREEQLLLAKAAHVVRFGDGSETEDGKLSPAARAFDPQQLLQVKRTADLDANLWTTFNVIQEHAIKGDLRAARRIDGRRPGMRAVNGIDGDIKLNKALWMLAEGMAKLKAA